MQLDARSLLSALRRDRNQRTTARASGRLADLRRGSPIPADLLVYRDRVPDTTMLDAIWEALGGTDSWRCLKAEFVATDPDAVAALYSPMNDVVAALSDAFTDTFGRRRWEPRPLDDGIDAWVVGVWEIEGVSTTVALARGLDATLAARRTRDALAALLPNEAGLVLTIGDDAGFEPPPGFASLPLTAAIRLNDEHRLSVVADLITRAVRARGRRTAHVGRPSVEAEVFDVLNGLKASAELDEDTACLAGIAARKWPEFHPDKAAPKPATLRKHARSWSRRGKI